MPNDFCRHAAAGIVSFGKRDPLIPIALCAMAGIILGDRFQFDPLWSGGFAALLLLAACCFRFPGRVLPAAIAVFTFSHTANLWTIRQFPFHRNIASGETIRITAEGLVATSPALLGFGNSRRCLIQVQRIGVAGRIWNCRHHLPVTIENPPSGFDYGQMIQFTGLLKPLETRRSPGAFAPDRFYFRSAGATAEVIADTGDTVRIVATDRGNPLIANALRSRTWIESAVTHGLENDRETAAVIKAMVLGAREDTPEEIEEQFRLSGAMHVFAVSGLHVGIFGLILWWILRWLRIPKRWAVGIIIPAILFYAVITGLRPSAVRAAVMGTIVLAGFVAERRPRLLNNLSFAAILILAFDTQQLFLPGFQLSFLVLASIALFADPLRNFFYRPFRIDPLIPRRLASLGRRSVDGFMRKFSAGLAVSLAAWAGSTILVIHHFQLMTPIAILTNLFLVPLAFCILGVAAVSTLLSLVGAGFLSAFLNQANASFAQLSTALAGMFAAVPGGHFHVSAGALAPQPECRITVLESSPGGISGLLSVRPERYRSAHWLIDPGTPTGFTGRVQPLLRHYGINRLQAIVLSHGDHRHISAASLALQRFPTGALIESPLPNRSPSYRQIVEELDRTGTVQQPITRGDRVLIGGILSAETLYPPAELSTSANADDQCLVLRLQQNRWRILFTFDSGFITEKWLLENEPDLGADVWIKGWHGQDSSGLTEFLEQVEPLAVITTHRDFPVRQRIPEAFRNQLKDRDIVLFDLAESGSVTLDFSRDVIKLTPFLTGTDQLTIDAAYKRRNRRP